MGCGGVSQRPTHQIRRRPPDDTASQQVPTHRPRRLGASAQHLVQRACGRAVRARHFAQARHDIAARIDDIARLALHGTASWTRREEIAEQLAAQRRGARRQKGVCACAGAGGVKVGWVRVQCAGRVGRGRWGGAVVGAVVGGVVGWGVKKEKWWWWWWKRVKGGVSTIREEKRRKKR